MGLSMKEKRNVIAAYRSRYMNAGRKEKTAIREELRFITGYNRKYALRILNKPDAQKALLLVKGKAVKPGGILKHRVPIRTFYTPAERKLPGFIPIDPVGL